MRVQFVIPVLASILILGTLGSAQDVFAPHIITHDAGGGWQKAVADLQQQIDNILDGIIVNWEDIVGIPAGFSDGIDDDTPALTEAEVDAFVANNGFSIGPHTDIEPIQTEILELQLVSHAPLSVSCPLGSSIRVIDEGIVQCEEDTDTKYVSGFGLALNGQTFEVDTGTMQRRVIGTCLAGQSILSIDSAGGVTCGAVGGGDNLGNHMATQDLDMKENDIVNFENLLGTGLTLVGNSDVQGSSTVGGDLIVGGAGSFIGPVLVSGSTVGSGSMLESRNFGNVGETHGLRGGAFGSINEAIGVLGVSTSTGGRGVSGVATAPSGFAFGVLGRSLSVSGVGIFGTSDGLTGTTFGVRGDSRSTAGTGVFGVNHAASGVTFGVRGDVSSPTGWGLYTSDRAFVGSDLDVSGSSTVGDDLNVQGNSNVGGDLIVGGAGSFIGPIQASSVTGTNELCIGIDCRTSWPAGGGSILSVIAGNGLTGGGSSGAVTLDVEFAGSGSANSVSRSDHVHALGWEIVTNFFCPTGTGQSCTATCPSGKVVVGGGYVQDPNVQPPLLEINAPTASGLGWVVKPITSHQFGTDAVVEAICINP